VLGHHREQIEKQLRLTSVVHNPDYELGMITSIQTGIRQLSPASEAAVLFLVDHPIVSPEVVDALIAESDPRRIVLPVYEGRRGHPVLFGAEVLAEILALPYSRGANDVVHSKPDRVVEVPVHEPGVLVDIDTPDQFDNLN
jgi:molybdenum cofactor cytidylyltransferase